jgi:hypothetical protein
MRPRLHLCRNTLRRHRNTFLRWRLGIHRPCLVQRAPSVGLVAIHGFVKGIIAELPLQRSATTSRFVANSKNDGQLGSQLAKSGHRTQNPRRKCQ